jgi:hypothetical protein
VADFLGFDLLALGLLYTPSQRLILPPDDADIALHTRPRLSWLFSVCAGILESDCDAVETEVDRC